MKSIITYEDVVNIIEGRPVPQLKPKSYSTYRSFIREMLENPKTQKYVNLRKQHQLVKWIGRYVGEEYEKTIENLRKENEEMHNKLEELQKQSLVGMLRRHFEGGV